MFELEPSHPILSDDKLNATSKATKAKKSNRLNIKKATSRVDNLNSNHASSSSSSQNADDNSELPNEEASVVVVNDENDESSDLLMSYHNSQQSKDFNFKGDLIWRSPMDRRRRLPIFDCCLFKYDRLKNSLRMSTASGVYFDFVVDFKEENTIVSQVLAVDDGEEEKRKEPSQIMILTNEDMFQIECKPVRRFV